MSFEVDDRGWLTVPAPARARRGEPCPLCGLPVDRVSVVALPMTGEARRVTMPTCEAGHMLMPGDAAP